MKSWAGNSADEMATVLAISIVYPSSLLKPKGKHPKGRGGQRDGENKEKEDRLVDME